MTDYETQDGDRLSAVELYGDLKSQRWDLVEERDDGTQIAVTEDGERLELTPIPGTEQEAAPGRPWKPAE